MGGNAFPSLNTPRMPPTVYSVLRRRIHAQLGEHFQHVATPTEAPGKRDHGDIDFLVYGPRSAPEPPGDDDVKPSRKKKHTHTGPRFKTEVVAGMVGAECAVRVGCFDAWSFAVRWPRAEGLSRGEAAEVEVEEEEEEGTVSGEPARYFQVDVNVLSQLEDFTWMKLMHAHGDLNMMITLTVRRKGLRISDHGFFLSIPEIEKDSPKLAQVFVTKDPTLVLRFLGMDEARYTRPFASWDELMEYAASNRFHDPGHGCKRSQEDGGVSTPSAAQFESKTIEDTDGHGEVDQAPAAAAAAATDPPHSVLALVSLTAPSAADASTIIPATIEGAKLDLDLSTTDKKRRVLRPMYRYWIEEYLPAHVDDPPGSAAYLTKQEIIAEMMESFGPELKQRYHDQRSVNMKRALEPKLWKAMRDFLSEQKADSGVATTAFKGWKRELSGEVEDKKADVAATGVVEAREAFKEMRYDDCLEWGKTNWRDIWQRQALIDKEKSDAVFRAKLEAETIVESLSHPRASTNGGGAGGDCTRPK